MEVTPAVPFNKTQDMTVVEMLTFWTMSARNKVRYWHIAAVSLVYPSTLVRTGTDPRCL